MQDLKDELSVLKLKVKNAEELAEKCKKKTEESKNKARDLEEELEKMKSCLDHNRCQ